jgi:hypothetical protein
MTAVKYVQQITAHDPRIGSGKFINVWIDTSQLSARPAGPAWHWATDVYVPLRDCYCSPFLATDELVLLVLTSHLFDRPCNVASNLSAIAPTVAFFMADVIATVSSRKR